MDWKSYKTPEGGSVKAALVDAPGAIDIAGVSATVGQWVVEEEKESDGVKVYSHYVVDAPDPHWAEVGIGLDAVLPPIEQGKPVDRMLGELEQRTEAELIDLAALYGLEGRPGEPLKTGLIHAIKEHLEGEGLDESGASATAAIRSDLAGIEGLDVPPNSSSTDPNPRSEEGLHPDRGVVDGEPGADTDGDGEADVDPDRPGGNASTEDWFTYRTNHGYTAEELADHGRDDLRDLDDR